METPIASSLVVAMSSEELRLYNQIPTEISLETSDGAATKTVGRQIVSSTLQGSICCWASPPRSIVVEAVPSFHPGTSCTLTSERFLDFDGLQRAEFSLSARYLICGDLFHLYFEARHWGPPVHVGPQSSVGICNRAP